MNPQALIRRFGGAATRQQLVAAGMTGYDITRAVRQGHIIRCRQARYVLPTTNPAIVTAVRVGGLLAGPSAAASYGLWSGHTSRIHISIGASSSRLRTNRPPSFSGAGRLTSDRSGEWIQLHWLRAGATPELGPECWRVSLETCLRQVAAWCDRETAIACLETAISIHGLSLARIAAIFRDAPARSRVLAAAVRRGSESGIESIVAHRLTDRGVRVRQQVEIPRVGRVDMEIVGTRVVVEVDGRQYHQRPGEFENDRRRDAELVALGYGVIRLSYSQVITNWKWCERVILDALACA